VSEILGFQAGREARIANKPRDGRRNADWLHGWDTVDMQERLPRLFAPPPPRTPLMARIVELFPPRKCLRCGAQEPGHVGECLEELVAIERDINRRVREKQEARDRENLPVFVDPLDPRFIMGASK